MPEGMLRARTLRRGFITHLMFPRFLQAKATYGNGDHVWGVFLAVARGHSTASDPFVRLRVVFHVFGGYESAMEWNGKLRCGKTIAEIYIYIYLVRKVRRLSCYRAAQTRWRSRGCAKTTMPTPSREVARRQWRRASRENEKHMKNKNRSVVSPRRAAPKLADPSCNE